MKPLEESGRYLHDRNRKPVTSSAGVPIISAFFLLLDIPNVKLERANWIKSEMVTRLMDITGRQICTEVEMLKVNLENKVGSELQADVQSMVAQALKEQICSVMEREVSQGFTKL